MKANTFPRLRSTGPAELEPPMSEIRKDKCCFDKPKGKMCFCGNDTTWKQSLCTSAFIYIQLVLLVWRHMCLNNTKTRLARKQRASVAFMWHHNIRFCEIKQESRFSFVVMTHIYKLKSIMTSYESNFPHLRSTGLAGIRPRVPKRRGDMLPTQIQNRCCFYKQKSKVCFLCYDTRWKAMLLSICIHLPSTSLAGVEPIMSHV